MANILIIEDEADIGELYRLSLESAGHEILGIYCDPEKALEEAKKMAEPDLVILDERLGFRSGSAYLPEYRSVFRYARIFLVSADVERVSEALALGFDEARLKPVTMRQLVDQVVEMLKLPR